MDKVVKISCEFMGDLIKNVDSNTEFALQYSTQSISTPPQESSWVPVTEYVTELWDPYITERLTSPVLRNYLINGSINVQVPGNANSYRILVKCKACPGYSENLTPISSGSL